MTMHVLAKTGDKQVADSVKFFLQKTYPHHAAFIKVFQEGQLCSCVVYDGSLAWERIEDLVKTAETVMQAFEWKTSQQ